MPIGWLWQQQMRTCWQEPQHCSTQLSDLSVATASNVKTNTTLRTHAVINWAQGKYDKHDISLDLST